jgi:hypothetical protein
MGANLRIGATVDVAELKAGMQQTVDEVKQAAQKIPIAFEEARGRTKTALNGISEDTKQAAQVVSIESAKVAQATKQFAAAQAELRNATIVAKDAKLDDAETTNLLAAAQQKAAVAAKELAEAKAAEARAVATAAEEEELSQNVVIRAFQRAAAAVSEASAEIKEQMISTAETGGLEAEGITAGFAGFSKLLGAGIAVGFAASYIDGLAKVNVELEHLAAKTGLSIESLAGLQQIMKETGGDFETVATGLVRMESNTEKLAQHDKRLTAAFTNLGLKIEDVWKAKPEELLQMIATGMANTADANIRANSAITIFGRGGQALIPILREQGTQLTANMKATGELTGITDASAEAARRWTQDTARLSSQFRAVMIPVMEHAEDVIRGIAATVEGASAVILTVFEAIGTAITAALFPLGKLGQLLLDLTTGQYARLIADAKAAPQQFANIWKAGFDDIKGYWAEVKRTLTDSSPLPPLPASGSGDTGELPPPKAKADKAFQRDEQELAAVRLQAAQNGYILGLQGEIEFWNKRLAAAKQGSDEYKRIVEKLAGLEEERIKQGAKPQKLAQVQEPTLSTSALNQIVEEMTAEVKEQQKEQVQAQREAIDEEIRLAAEAYKEAEQFASDEVKLGKMSADEKITYLRRAANEQARIEQALVQAKQILDNGDLAKQQKDANQSVQIERSRLQKLKQLLFESDLERKKNWDAAINGMTDTFARNMAVWASGQQSFAQTWARTLQGMTEAVVQNLAKQAVAYAVNSSTEEAFEARQKLRDAASAARGAFKSVMHALPFPANVIVAPVAAAGAFAAVEAFEYGGVVKGAPGMAVPVLAHAGERVLTPTQTQNFDTLVNNRSSSSSSSSNLNVDLDQHFYGSKASPREAARGMNEALRRGRVRYA